MRRVSDGFTLIELVIGAAILAIAITALLGAFIGQMQLNEHARNVTYATNDATRVMERLRFINSGAGCDQPTAVPPTAVPPFYTWNDWLADTTASGGGGKSIQPGFPFHELIVVTCRNNNDLTQYCGSAAANSGQIGTNGAAIAEWQWLDALPTSRSDNTPPYDPIRLDVAVCWRVGSGPSRGRVMGECTWNAGTNQLVAGSATDANANGVIDSPVMLSTIMTCRK